MRAAALKSGQIYVNDDVPDPAPGFGQVLVQVKACGICGSDLHFAKHGADMLALGKEMGGMPAMESGPDLDLSRDVYMGHEFSAEVLDVGPDTVAPPAGTIVTSIPILFTPEGALRPIVYSNEVAAGYGERMLLSAPMITEVPNGLDFRHAALTEPMAVGLHAVNKSRHRARRGRPRARVRARRPRRHRRLEAEGHRHHRRHRLLPRSPRPRHHHGRDRGRRPQHRTGLRGVEPGRQGKPLVCFEAIGVPGIIDGVLKDAPHSTRLVVVGVCMETDRINPFFGISKELNVQFCLGYDPMEFNDTLRAIAEGELPVAPLITGEVDLDGVAGAFEALANPDDHCKILVMP